MENSSMKKLNQTHVTEDLWYEIFLRLTLHSIFQSRCVSKLWLSILSNPSFVKKWYELNISSLPWGFVHKAPTPTPEHPHTRLLQVALPDLHSQYVSHHGFSFKFLRVIDERIGIRLLGSSNGLVLCEIILYRQKGYYVCNPLTQNFVLLPPPPGNQYRKIVTGFMCNDECFSESTSYKVVRIPKFEAPTKEFKIEMFSSDVGEWNVYHISCPPDATWEFNFYKNYVAHNDVLYWFDKRNNKILAVSENECRCINMPDLEVNGRDAINIVSQFLGESEGLICLARFNTLEGNLSVWMLDGDHWDMLHKDIKLHDQLTGGKDLIKYIEVVGFSPVDKNVVILSCKKYVWAYNTKTRESEQLCHPSFLGSNVNYAHPLGITFEFVFKPRPTILPPISWSAASFLDESFLVANSSFGFNRFRNFKEPQQLW